MSPLNFVFTHHYIERLNERFSTYCQGYEALYNYQSDNPNRPEIRKILDPLITQGSIEKSYLNNSVYMVDLYDKYGYDMDYLFICYEPLGILSVLVRNKDTTTYTAATVLNSPAFPIMKPRTMPSYIKGKKENIVIAPIYTISESKEHIPEKKNKKEFYLCYSNHKVPVVTYLKSLSSGKNYTEYLIEPQYLELHGFYNALFAHARHHDSVIKNTKMLLKTNFCSIVLNGQEIFFVTQREKSFVRNLIIDDQQAQHYMDSWVNIQKDDWYLLKLLQNVPKVPFEDFIVQPMDNK